MELKTRYINRKGSQKEDLRALGAWGSRPSDGAVPMHPLSDCFYHRFLAFWGPFSRCSVWVLRRDSISGHVWYGRYELIEARYDGLPPSEGWKMDVFFPILREHFFLRTMQQFMKGFVGGTLDKYSLRILVAIPGDDTPSLEEHRFFFSIEQLSMAEWNSLGRLV